MTQIKANIYSNDELIGTTCLQVGDETMGGLFGEFKPNETYFKVAQNVFRNFWKTQNPDYSELQKLRLNVQLENGYFLFPAGGITIADVDDSSVEHLQIDIAGVNSFVFENFINKSTLPEFVQSPWNTLDIRGKIGLENELMKEIGTNKKSFSIFNLFKPVEKPHDLSEFEFSAFSRDQSNDDVLFAIRNSKSIYQFALVHLTWKGQKEKPGYPRTKFYIDFDEFLNSRMKADIADWN